MTKLILPFVLMGLLLSSGCAPSASSGDAEKLRVANEMVRAWNELDWDRVFGLFAEDGVLHSMMLDPIVGREAIRAHFEPMIPGLERLELQVANIGIINDVVVVERVDDFDYNGRHARVPTAGVMVIADGKVREWREYCDRPTMLAALGASPATGSTWTPLKASLRPKSRSG